MDIKVRIESLQSRRRFVRFIHDNFHKKGLEIGFPNANISVNKELEGRMVNLKLTAIIGLNNVAVKRMKVLNEPSDIVISILVFYKSLMRMQS